MGKGKSVKTATEFEIQRRILRKAFITSLFVFLLVLSGAFVGWYFANSAVEGRQIQKFQNLGSAMANAIQEQMNQYIDVIYDAKRFFANSEVVTRDEWRTFLSPVIVQNRYPGVRAVRFIRRVREREKGAFIQEVKLDTSLVPGGYPQFDIHSTVSLESQFTEVNKEYYPVTYVEPYVGNETMLGLDVHTDPSVWAQYQASISTDEPMIDSVILVDTDKVDAFKLCLAIYAKNLPLNTFQERMSAVNGFVDLLVIKKYFFEPSFTQKNLYKDI
ncbi:MAG: CHASE domain-containing protein, partial [Candidatus Omnitrophica bacterium]|nr:CHASE domain-containing protein [Candidatus Omnitrophota bacterium]